MFSFFFQIYQKKETYVILKLLRHSYVHTTADINCCYTSKSKKNLPKQDWVVPRRYTPVANFNPFELNHFLEQEQDYQQVAQ